MTTYSNQLRALADRLRNGEEVPMASIVITLEEAAEKIDMLDVILQTYHARCRVELECSRNVNKEDK